MTEILSSNAVAFLNANAESPVVSGRAIQQDASKPAEGVVYRLKDGRSFTLSPGDCLQLPLPRWDLPA
ncbi:hypothetical protein [Novosphingobium rosa]|uniref:hypothetical protein n=1 Tax=Novosphingobium rosa TaxID=76978 RepID=UPI000AAC9B84|nr:hypothetical protein [Novosphingobium rosa]